MANSPNSRSHSPYFTPSPENDGVTLCPAWLDPPKRAPSRTSPRTQYEFIMSTGDESATSAKQKLKTVRSHVMKNYLHQQQQRQGQSGEASSRERRKAKQSVRSHRSLSRGSSACSPTESEGGRSGTSDVRNLFSDFAFASPSGESSATDYFSTGTTQPFALDFDFSAQQDEAARQAQAYIACLRRDKEAGLLEPSFETLNAKGDTVRMVMNVLGVLGNDVPQSVIFAVCLLAFGCAVDNEWDQASSHLGALHRILDARGGVETVDFELQRTSTWVGYSFAGALRLPPQFLPPLFGGTISFPLAFLDDAQIRAWRTAKRFPKNCSFVFDVAVRLHQIGLASSPEYHEDIDQRALSNVYFEAMHHALAIQVDEPWAQVLIKGAQAQETSTMFQTWAAGLSLYIWGTDRHVRRRRGLAFNGELHGPIFARLKEILDRAGGHQSWPHGKSLEPVLVTLFYALDACDIFHPWRIWLVDTIRKVVDMLKLKRSEEFKKVLEFFPLTPDYRVTADHIWNEIVQQERTTPTLTFSALQ